MRSRVRELGKRPPRISGLNRNHPRVSRETALSGANPSRDRENCVVACHAWLLRRLGYDVVAPPGPYDPPGVIGSTVVYSTKFWRTPKGQVPGWSDPVNSTPESVLFELERRPAGHHGLLRYSGFPAHVMGWEKRKNGIILVDPQSGTESSADFRYGDHGSFQWVDMTGCRPVDGISSLFKEASG